MQNHTHHLTIRLDQRGVSQTVITAHRPGAPKWQRIGSRSEVFRVGVPIPWFRQLYALPAARTANRIAARADLVHAHLGEDVAVLPIAYRAARRHGLPLVVTVHCSVRHTLSAVDVRTALLKLIGGAVEGVLLPKADAVIALTERAASAVGAVDDVRVHVIPPGADASRFAGPLPDPLTGVGRPRIVFVGRLARAKGIDVLISAARRLRCKAEVVIVGDGPERARLEREAASHSNGRIHFTGFVPHELVPAVLTHADVLVLPSRYEELGSVLIDALQARLPVVASAVGGIPSVVVDGENGLTVRPGDADELSMALDRVIGDGSLKARLADGAAARAPLYSWDSVAERVMTVYEEVAGAPRAAMLASSP
jgi:2-deoxystreptamine N-acetyl-D-glucosaminyltransferase/2-deoxystreptamine glucosyltransferase